MTYVSEVRHQDECRGAMADMTWIAGGTFQMGSDTFYPEERPAHDVTVDGFWIERCPVTNEEFARFVDATGYVTLAERAPRRRRLSWCPAGEPRGGFDGVSEANRAR